MSDHAARAALERMNCREVAIARHYTGLLSDLRQMSTTDPEEGQRAFLARRGELCAAYGFSDSQQRKPFAFANGLAIIPVHGTLINRFGQSYGYVTGYNFLRSQLNLALLDDDVKGILFDCNSYGGEAAGCFELADDIYAARGTKPMVAVVDSNCYSACYAVASACDKIVVTPSGGSGSIGVVAMHMDMSGLLADWGITVTFIHFGEHKVDGNPFQALPDNVRADIQEGVNASGEKFVSLVARNRNLDVQVVRDTEARIYRAEAAMALGLIDAIATPIAAVQAFFSELSGSISLAKEDPMSTEDQKPDQAATEKAAADARTAERARVSGIITCEEAKGRTQLANHLAMKTDMSVEQAKETLAAAPVEAAAPAASNQFQTAMDTGDHPNVGAGGSGAGEQSAAAQILAAQSAATGVKFDKQ